MMVHVPQVRTILQREVNSVGVRTKGMGMSQKYVQCGERVRQNKRGGQAHTHSVNKVS